MPDIVAVSGASGSGKSTFADALKTYLEKNNGRVCVIAADRYFKKDLPKMISPATGEEASDWNHPDSVDMPAFLAAVTEAKESGGIVIACGMAKREDDTSVAPVFERADQNMYENKNRLKAH